MAPSRRGPTRLLAAALAGLLCVGAAARSSEESPADGVVPGSASCLVRPDPNFFEGNPDLLDEAASLLQVHAGKLRGGQDAASEAAPTEKPLAPAGPLEQAEAALAEWPEAPRLPQSAATKLLNLAEEAAGRVPQGAMRLMAGFAVLLVCVACMFRWRGRLTEGLSPVLLRRVLLLMLAVIVVGVAGISNLEGRSIMTSLYIVVQVLTTVGYGDFPPQHQATRVFLTVYVLGGLVVVSYLLNFFIERLLQAQSEGLSRHLREVQARIVRSNSGSAGAGSSAPEETAADEAALPDARRCAQGYSDAFQELLAAALLCMLFVTFGAAFFGTYEACACSYGLTQRAGCVDDTYELCVSTGGVVKTPVDAIYMAVITLTGVGFGDITPITHVGRTVGMVWMIVGVCATANFVGKMSRWFFEQGQQSSLLLQSFEIDENTFKEMDQDGSGTLSQAEYRSYLLVKSGLISREILDTIDAQYALLDAEGTNRVTLDSIRDLQARSMEATIDAPERALTAALVS